MSGIVGFINIDREPANPEILLRIARPLQKRAPDGINTWRSGSTGLGHALLETSPKPNITSQPFSADGVVWVTSDTHLCGIEELVQKLRSAGMQTAPGVSEPELLVQAYRAFGDTFARNLTGDFALAIWDDEHKKLICARDHLGVRPLFYAHTGDLFVFGSDIDALRAHPKVSEELSDDYIADFLLFGLPADAGATAYKHIKRLPAAHYLTVSAGGIQLCRYWSPPAHQSIRYSHAAEYTEHFADLFEKAVTERMPSTPVALELSGGMDSSSIATVAAAYARKRGQQITACTYTCHTLMPKAREGHYAKGIAAHLDIPVHCTASENYPLFDRFDTQELRTAEPFGNPGLAQHYDNAKRIIDSGSRVLLTGQMADTLFAGSSTYFPHLLKTGRLVRLITDARDHRKNLGSLTGTGLGAAVKQAVSKFRGKKPWQPEFPHWLNPDFGRRAGLRDRWDAIWNLWNETDDAAGQLHRPWFSTVFENYEAVQLPLVARHPFSDIRLVKFMLGVPNHMNYNKRMLRETMRERLPAEIVSRPKESLPGDLIRAKMATDLRSAIPNLGLVEDYLDARKFVLAYETFLESSTSESTWSSSLINNPIALAHWMNNNGRRLEED